MARPNLLKPKRLMTMSMSDKYTAVCFIYEGKQYQELCRQNNPDGTYNYSEGCLAMLPYYSWQQSYLEYSPNASSPTSLIKYPGQQVPATRNHETSNFESYFWILVTLCVLYAIHRIYKRLGYQVKRRGQVMTEPDDQGYLIAGKIKYRPAEILGRGSSGTCVFKGYYEDSQECAVKRLEAHNLKVAERELLLLRNLQHTNVVRYFATESDCQFVYIAIGLGAFTIRRLVEDDRFEEIGLSKEDVCLQAATGLAYLHDSNIVHRDIKPENILVSRAQPPNGTRVVMLTDFGLCRVIRDDDLEYPSSAAKSDGTIGWMAPELIAAKRDGFGNLKASQSSDIFSLGCFFYYVIFNGKHPFGDPEQRQRNILDNNLEIDKFKLDENVEEALGHATIDLVEAMVARDPEYRPPISAVMRYPLFWSKKEQMLFLCQVSDEFDKCSEDARRELEYHRKNVFGMGWLDKLSPAFREELETNKRRSYSTNKMQDLIRVIRNKRNHSDYTNSKLQEELGISEEQQMKYYLSRFPKITIQTFKNMQAFKDRHRIKDFYANTSYKFPNGR